MLKKICGLFLGLIVCAGSACVTPTHASSADDDMGATEDIVITQIQASGEFGAKDEYVVLHNNSGIEYDITSWCLMNKSNVMFACLSEVSGDTNVVYYVPPYGDIVFVSRDHASANTYPDSVYTIVYDVTNQSSGSIVNSSDRIAILGGGRYIDTKSWDSAIPTGKVLSRMLVMAGPDIYAHTNTISDWMFENRAPLPLSSVRRVVGENPMPEPAPEEDPLIDTSVVVPPIITEILANPAGSDTDKEFIELYNPNEQVTISLDSFTLLIGTSTTNVYTFPAGATIPPLGYVTFSNEQMGYTLVNTTGKVQLVENGVNSGESVGYVSPKDDYSWALIGGVWQYMKPATPGTVNALEIDNDDSQNSADASVAKPCAANQFRNPETGRCKLINTASSAPTPCKENQERNPETNRCRNITTTTTPAPCKEGQERSSETNRCRAIVKMSNAGYGVGVKSKADAAMSWYYWAGIAAILLLVIGYGVWEWRQELATLWAHLRATFAKHSD